MVPDERLASTVGLFPRMVGVRTSDGRAGECGSRLGSGPTAFQQPEGDAGDADQAFDDAQEHGPDTGGEGQGCSRVRCQRLPWASTA